MAKKHKVHKPSHSPQEIRSRILIALEQERTHTALDLARNLFKQDRSPENLQLLQRATLARAQQLRSQGQTRDAATLLNNALDMGDAAFLKEIAEELAHCGQAKQALELLKKIGPNGQSPIVLTAAVDAALRQGVEGRKNLPDELHPQFNMIVQSFQHLEAGRDEEARNCLHEIGLNSPFLEWKLLLRGLVAYWNNDDARALENWNRLDHQRVPARLAAPFRFQIDKDFREAQPPAAQMALRDVLERLQGASVASTLRRIQGHLAAEDKVTDALRLMEQSITLVKQQVPDLLPRLANCFYWAIIDKGMPDDIDRYEKIFGAPADDPDFYRMQALALERQHMINDANRSWEEYAKQLEQFPGWSEQQHISKARALIWRHMGDNSAQSESGPQLPAFLRGALPGLGQKAEKPPQVCYQKSLQYDPDYLAAHEALFHFLRDSKKVKEALTAGHELIKRFPNHVQTLEELGDVHLRQGEYDKAVALLRQALQHNPLERRLRSKVAGAHLERGREFAAEGKLDEARKDLEMTLALDDPKTRRAVCCVQAACEFKANQTERGEELVAQASQLGEALEVHFRMAAEAARLKLPSKMRTRFAKAFTEGIASTPTPGAVVAVLQTLAAFDAADVDYYGYKSQAKKILAYVEKAAGLPFSETDLEIICDSLLSLKNKKLVRKYLQVARRRFPENPVFPLINAELSLSEGSTAMWHLPNMIQESRRLIDRLPAGERKQKLINRVQALEELLKAKALQHFPFESFMGAIFDEFDDDDEDEDEDY